MADQLLDAFPISSLSLDDESYVLWGTVDPTQGAGIAAPSSSTYHYKPAVGTAKLFLKTGVADTAWTDVSSASGGTVTSISTIQPASGLTISGGPITTSGTFTFALANDLNALESLSSTGFAVRTNTDAWAQRQITSSSGTISIVNPAGVVGDPSIDLATIGTPVTNLFRKFTTDSYGRVTATSAVVSTDITTALGYTPIAPSLYSAATNLTMNTNRILGRTTAGVGAAEEITIGSGLSLAAGVLSSTSAGGSVTTVSVVSANGFAGTVANPTSTPAITLSTTVTGIVKANGTALSAAVAATDYVAPSLYASTNGLTMSTNKLLGRTTASAGPAEEISVGTGLVLAGGVLSATAADTINRIWSASLSSSSGNTVITPSASAPLVTDGVQLWSQTISPTTITTRFSIVMNVGIDVSVNYAAVTLALFRNNTFIAGAIYQDVASVADMINLNATDLPATTSPVTYQVRVGVTSGTYYVNRRQTENTFGGMRGGYIIMEVL